MGYIAISNSSRTATARRAAHRTHTALNYPPSSPDIQESRICTRVVPVPTMAKSGVKKPRKSTQSPRSSGRSGVPEAREARRKKKAGRPKTSGAPSTAPSRSCRVRVRVRVRVKVKVRVKVRVKVSGQG